MKGTNCFTNYIFLSNIYDYDSWLTYMVAKQSDSKKIGIRFNFMSDYNYVSFDMKSQN